MNGRGIDEAVRADFDACLASAHEEGALELAIGLVVNGVSAEEVLLDLVAPAQVRVGERWASGEWTVAQEHAATYVSRRTVDAVVATARATGRPPVEPGSRGDVLVACSDGEWHVLPSQIVAEVLRLRGFRVRSLGGHVSPYGLLSDVEQNGPDVLALSCTLARNLPLAHRQIEACRSAGVPVIAGGPGFGPAGTWAYALGADFRGADARDAAETLLRCWPPELCGESAVEADAVEAYAMLVRQRPELLEHLMRELTGLLDALRGGAGREHEEAAEFLGGLLDYLAAAVFVEDARVFTGQLAFAWSYLTARNADTGCLAAAVEVLTDRLRGSPRILDKLSAGRTWLDEQQDGSRATE